MKMTWSVSQIKEDNGIIKKGIIKKGIIKKAIIKQFHEKVRSKTASF